MGDAIILKEEENEILNVNAKVDKARVRFVHNFDGERCGGDYQV